MFLGGVEVEGAIKIFFLRFWVFLRLATNGQYIRNGGGSQDKLKKRKNKKIAGVRKLWHTFGVCIQT